MAVGLNPFFPEMNGSSVDIASSIAGQQKGSSTSVRDMSSFWIPARRRLCLNCIRSSIGEDGPQVAAPSWTQVRGKKKKVKGSETINVRLLVNMKGYGRKG